MVMHWIWMGMIALSVLCACINGQGGALSAAVSQGAQAGITLVISISGSICLWCGIGRLTEKTGLRQGLSRLLSPLLCRIFPSCKNDPVLLGSLSANVCANLLGLGNAATPMGIQAARRLASRCGNGVAGDELCRLIVLNTASIQLIPSNVAAVRASLGCGSPFDILPAVWFTSLCSAGAGLTAAWVFGRLWKK